MAHHRAVQGVTEALGRFRSPQRNSAIKAREGAIATGAQIEGRAQQTQRMALFSGCLPVRALKRCGVAIDEAEGEVARTGSLGACVENGE